MGSYFKGGDSRVVQVMCTESEDERIHCFKPKEPCHAGRQQLKSQLSVLDDMKEIETILFKI